MTMKSKVLALKYRPQTFDDLIGQEVIAETIKNSINADKIPNAYLFTGIRGVGKTTIARIIAKSINCKKSFENQCKEKCDICDSITNSNHIDVLEMDAASKTGVDDVRDLIEFSRYGPSSAKYKIFIIDEVHMLSKQAFNALLKTLEEPPDYLKFIFATTEIKKIPVTVISRCQRFDLSRIKSEKLYEYIKKIKDKEKGKVSDDVLKLIVKISEGSVRDALSLLDRGLLGTADGNELNLKKAHEIYGYLDKSSLIDLFYYLFEGNENNVIKIYRDIYEKGIEPKNFLNDFLEILYYFKNISSIKLDGTDFTLNDDEYKKINEISEKIHTNDLILFWEFTIKTLSEIETVSNPNLSIEMFLIKLVHLKDFNKSGQETIITDKISSNNQHNHKKITKDSKIIEQIKNISQEDKEKLKIKSDDIKSQFSVSSFNDLISLCHDKKEIKLKYELETNINLVAFSEGRIEIAFNENLDKNFIKELSNKLFTWTDKRWIISLSKSKGLISKKDSKKNKKKKLYEDVKNSTIYKNITKTLPDAELIDAELEDQKND